MEAWRGGGPWLGGGRWRGEPEGEQPGPAPPPPPARGARAPRRPAFPRRVTSALRSHYPDYPDNPAPANGTGRERVVAVTALTWATASRGNRT